MTAVMNAPASTQAKRGGGAPRLATGAPPSVQLLPPSVRERGVLRSRVRTAVLLVVLGLVVAGAITALGFLRNATAQLQLADANARTAELLQQQAEFADVVQLDALISQTQELQRSATSYEVLWNPLLAELAARLPAGAELASVSADAQAPWDAALSAEDPLRTPRIVTLQLSLVTTTIPEASEYARRLADLTGFADAVLGPVAVGADGRVTSTVSLTLSTDAVSERFTEADEEDPDEGTEDEPGETADEEDAS